ncbi:MAG: PEBP family protein [Actinomycetia bacterium]|nr:PEBP family protein [Actinomycetes bacterium]
MNNPITPWKSLPIVLVLLLAACSSTGSETSDTETPTATAESTTSATEVSENLTDEAASSGSGFVAEVWADNWFALYVNGELVGEDSVPITTERSFNAETIMFEADYPLTIAIEAKDFKETDSGIEYIGEPKQQMGDGGLIAQITDMQTGQVIAVTSSDWSTLVVHQAPLNIDCVSGADPDATCNFYAIDNPADWIDRDFDDGSWVPATEWSTADVSPKDGYDEIDWDSTAELVWGSDLEVDNTILLRLTVEG